MNSLVKRQLMMAVYRYMNGPVPFGLTITFFASLALFWTACTGALDYFLLSTVERHCVAAGFPKAEGRIIESEVDSERPAGGVENRASIVYRYHVDGKEYEANHFRFDEVWSGRPEDMEEVVAAYPVGRTLDVFYDPADPSRAALTAGLTGADLVWAMAVLPLNLLVLWLWGFIGGMTYRHFVKPPAGGATISSDGYTTLVRLAGVSPLTIAMLHLSGMAWLGAMGVVLSKGFNPTLSVVYIVWAAIVAEATLACALRWMRFARGGKCLTIDETGRKLSLPKMYRRKEAMQIPFDNITELEVKLSEKTDFHEVPYTKYAPTITFSKSDGSLNRAKIVEWWNRTDAYAFAGWMREQIGWK